jgi:ankyrin repeat protein
MKNSLYKLLNYFKRFIHLIVLIGFSVANAGSYDDFFRVIESDDHAQLEHLLQRGFDPNTVNSEGQYGLMLALKLRSLKVARLLVDWPNTVVEVRNAADESPLMLAALNGDLALARVLINRNADVNKTGWSPLHYAATNGHLDVINLLLEENAYIDATSPNGTTPLMMAAHYGTSSAVKLLLELGADPMLKNEQGLAAFDFANRASHTDSAMIISAFVRSRRSNGVW